MKPQFSMKIPLIIHETTIFPQTALFDIEKQVTARETLPRFRGRLPITRCKWTQGGRWFSQKGWRVVAGKIENHRENGEIPL